MRLVGIKTEEMAEEGRSTCILINPRFPHHHKQSAAGPEDATRHRLLKAKVGCSDNSYASLAAKECRELEQKKRQQLQQLVLLLRRIETAVNSHHNTIIERLDDYRLSLRGLFQKATAYLSSIRRPDQLPDPTLVAAFKLLQATFKHMGLTLSSVEDDVEALVQALAEKMCKPMESHVQGLVAETEGGLERRLVGLVEEMERAARERGAMVEAAGKRTRKAEEAEAEAVKRLRKLEEKMRGVKELAGLFMEAKRRGMEASASARKLLGAEKEESCDEKLLWDILCQKRQVGPTDLRTPQRKPSTTFHHAESQHKRYLHGDEISTSRKNSSTNTSQRPRTRNYSRILAPQAQHASVGPSFSAFDKLVNGHKKH